MATERAPHNMTANNSPSPYVASASSAYTGSYAAFKAFDGALGTFWATNSTQTGWLKIDMGAGNTFVITNYNVVANNANEPNRAPKAWTLEGSNDDVTYDVIDTVSGQTAWGNGEDRAFVCDVATTAYRYFKINVTENNTDAFLAIGEMYLQGEPATVTSGSKSFQRPSFMERSHFDSDRSPSP